MNTLPKGECLAISVGASNIGACTCTIEAAATSGFRVSDTVRVSWTEVSSEPAERRAVSAFSLLLRRMIDQGICQPKAITNVSIAGAGTPEGSHLRLDKYPEKGLDFSLILPQIGIHPEQLRIMNDAVGEALAYQTLESHEERVLYEGRGDAVQKLMLMRLGTGAGVAVQRILPNQCIVISPSEGGNLPAAVWDSGMWRSVWSDFVRWACHKMTKTGFPGLNIRELEIEGLTRGPIIEPRLENFTASLGLILLGIWASEVFGIAIRYSSPQEVEHYMLSRKDRYEMLREAYSGVIGFHLRCLAMMACPDKVVLGGVPSRAPRLLNEKELVSAFQDAPLGVHQEMLQDCTLALLSAEANSTLCLKGAAYALVAEELGKQVFIV